MLVRSIAPGTSVNSAPRLVALFNVRFVMAGPELVAASWNDVSVRLTM